MTRKSRTTLEGDVARAVEDMRRGGNKDRLNRTYGRTVSQNPAPKDIIYAISEYCRTKE